MYFYRARYYSPSLQRFISQDPIGFGGGDPNLYGYVGNDPANFNDPSGEDPIWGGIRGAIAGVESGYIYSDGSVWAALAGGVFGGAAGAAIGTYDYFSQGAIEGAIGGAIGGALGNGLSQGSLLASGQSCGFNSGTFAGAILGGVGVGAINGSIPEAPGLPPWAGELAKILTSASLGPLGPGLGTAIGGYLAGSSQ